MKQYTSPLIIREGESATLKKIDLRDNEYDEDWIQQLCYENPGFLPMDELEPCFGGSVAVCRELETPSGQCDLLYINEQGYITLVECKLWRNPEARRTVVGQILDYAKELNKWDYEQLEVACLKKREDNAQSLVEFLTDFYPDLNESEFIDNVQENLKKGRFMLLVVGDGIRENMEELADYLQGSGGLNFTLSMIELPVYRVPESNELIVTPRVLVKTREIERTFFRIAESDRLEERESTGDEPQRSSSISEQAFYERLTTAKGTDVAKSLSTFVEGLTDGGMIRIKMGRGKKASLNIKSADDTYNFASVQENGEVFFYGIVSKTEEVGNRQIGIDYLKKLANLVNGQFCDGYSQWHWCVLRGEDAIPVTEYLMVKDQWKNLIQSTLNSIQELSD